MPASTITSKGQTTIPKEIRELLHLQLGDRIDFVVNEDGKVVLQPVNLDFCTLEGLLHRPGMKAITNAMIKTAVKRRFR